MAPLLSIVVPVFNGGAYLSECLASIARAVEALPERDRAQVEVVICDNWSTDGSHDIAQAATFGCAASVIRPAEHEPNRTRNWEYGLRAARGEWQVMVHADDLMAPRGAVNAIRAARLPGAERATMIVGRHRTFERSEDPTGLRPRWTRPSLVSGPMTARHVLPFHCPFVPFTIMRAEAYKAVGGLDERWQLVQDWELWMRLAAKGDILFYPGEIGWWRRHPTSPAYRHLNAREHVALADSVERSIGPLPRSRMALVRRIAKARATLITAGLPPEEAADDALTQLPDESAARTQLKYTMWRVMGVQTLLRAAGTARLAVARR